MSTVDNDAANRCLGTESGSFALPCHALYHLTESTIANPLRLSGIFSQNYCTPTQDMTPIMAFSRYLASTSARFIFFSYYLSPFQPPACRHLYGWSHILHCAMQ